VALQRKAGQQWVTVARSRVGNRARFVIRWRPKSVRRVVLRVAIGSSRKRIGRAVIYRRALASWYGPGLYGGALACGGRLKRGTLGVANKRLPCGSKVTVRFRGRSVRVPVVDRGPYVGGREFDLTSAVRDRLGFDGVGTVLVSR
jgi:rare lipoprotein A (peptidoglycan hydrolase)